MTIRYAEARLPQRYMSHSAAAQRARRAFWRGAAIFGMLGFLCGWLV